MLGSLLNFQAIFMVHPNDQVKSLKVFRHQWPGLWGEMNIPVFGCSSHALVCIFAFVIRPMIFGPQLVPDEAWEESSVALLTPQQPCACKQLAQCNMCTSSAPYQFSLPPPVPHESMKNSSDTPERSTTFLKTASAVGLRQILPVTNKQNIKNGINESYGCSDSANNYSSNSWAQALFT